MNKPIDIVSYKGYKIVVLETWTLKFGIMYECQSILFDSLMDIKSYSTKAVAIEAEKKLIDAYIICVDSNEQLRSLDEKQNTFHF